MPEPMAAAATIRPIRDGLFQLDPPCLLGTRCPACGTTVFPAKPFCPHCHSDAAPCAVKLSPHGVVCSYTVIHQAPPGRPTPYVLAYVDLEDGVRVLAQVRHEPDAMRMGMPVALNIERVASDAQGDVVGYVFVPATQDNKEIARA